MKLNEALRHALKRARQMKEEHIRSYDPENDVTDIAGLVEGFRAGQVAIAIMPREISRDTALTAARLAAFLFSADIVTVTTETWFTTDPVKNPITGQPWQPGEMEQLVREHDALDKGWVREALHVVAVNRAGDVVSGTAPYKIERKHRKGQPRGAWDYSLRWYREALFEEGDRSLTGFIPDMLKSFMNEPTLEVINKGLGGDKYGLSPDEARTMTDIIAIKQAKDILPGAYMLGYEPGTRRAELIEEYMATL